MPRLVRVRPGVDSGIRRVRSGTGFRYLDERGNAVAAAENERIRDLVIPPAWEDVWISTDPYGHIQAVGVDRAGRRQYLYHPRWRARRDRRKFRRGLALAEALPQARRKVTSALRRDGLGRERVLAASFRLLDEGAPRVGSARYLQRHGSRGLTTLERRNASVHGATIVLSFPGKAARRALIELQDEDLAVLITELTHGRQHAPLLAYARGRKRVPLTPDDVNAHVRSLTGGAFTAKDFRTLRGTILAAESLARTGRAGNAKQRRRAEKAAVEVVSGGLGNTPAVARSSYIDPRVFAAYRRGEMLDLSVAPETAIVRLLNGAAVRRGR